MVKIIALSGSLRKGSFNTAVLRAAADLAPGGTEVEVVTPHGIPLYNADDEKTGGIPDVVAKLKDKIAGADGFMLSTPEYNNSMAGVAKNAVDWLTRPADDIARVFRGLPMALCGASPGGFGTTLAQSSWAPVVRTLGMKPYYGARLVVSRAHGSFSGDGVLEDDELREKISEFITGFSDFVKNHPRGF